MLYRQRKFKILVASFPNSELTIFLNKILFSLLRLAQSSFLCPTTGFFFNEAIFFPNS